MPYFIHVFLNVFRNGLVLFATCFVEIFHSEGVFVYGILLEVLNLLDARFSGLVLDQGVFIVYSKTNFGNDVSVLLYGAVLKNLLLTVYLECVIIFELGGFAILEFLILLN